MDENVKLILQYIVEAEKHLENLKIGLQNYRDACQHDFKVTGNGCGWDIIECTKCGKGDIE